MKSRQIYSIRIALLILVSLSGLANSHAQGLDQAAVKDLITSRNFVFKAQTALPLGGQSRQLTSDYDLRVYGDSLIAYLPYFGRAYTAPAPGEGGLNFTSVNYLYHPQETKKGGWNVTIQPKDTRDVRLLFLSVSSAGYGTLQVTSNNRQAISFSGYITPRK